MSSPKDSLLLFLSGLLAPHVSGLPTVELSAVAAESEASVPDDLDVDAAGRLELCLLRLVDAVPVRLAVSAGSCEVLPLRHRLSFPTAHAPHTPVIHRAHD